MDGWMVEDYKMLNISKMTWLLVRDDAQGHVFAGPNMRDCHVMRSLAVIQQQNTSSGSSDFHVSEPGRRRKTSHIA